MINEKQTQDMNDIYGQYASDNFGKEGVNPDATGTRDSRGDGSMGFHGENEMWDQERTTVPDEATGETDHIAGEFDELTVDAGIAHEALDAAMGMSDDEAARWLVDHDK